MESVKIASLELENVKRVRALSLEPTKDGLTVIGGRNGQGKTSVLDAIAWALGGDRKRPERPTRDGSATPASLRVELSNGLVVERKGKNGTLKVTDPEGRRAGQQLINSFVEELALDLPKFMSMSDREKADELLQIIGVGDELAKLDRELALAEDERRAVGQQKRAKQKVADDAPFYADAPLELVGAADLIREQQDILARNGENQRKRERAAQISRELDEVNARVRGLEGRLKELQEELRREKDRQVRVSDDYMTATKTAEQLRDESTAEIEARLADIDATNEKVRANQRRAEMMADAEALDEEYKALDAKVADVRDRRSRLLDGADMPLAGLSVDGGRLTYRGASWGDMSGSEQLRVATAIVRKLKPECGFVLVDKLEQMDPQTLSEFGSWAASEGLQVIGTRVATDGTCSVVIEDGRAVETMPADAPSASDAAEHAAAPVIAQPAPKAPETFKPSLQMGVF